VELNLCSKYSDISTKDVLPAVERIIVIGDLHGDWEETIKSLKIANTISGSNNSTKDTKLEINSLIREIDYCISQLTE
jgi:hypothetical protein